MPAAAHLLDLHHVFEMEILCVMRLILRKPGHIRSSPSGHTKPYSVVAMTLA